MIYSSLFEYPLTLTELRRTLIGQARTDGEILRTYESSERLRAAIEYRGGLFFPAGRRDWIEERWGREARSLAFLQRQRRLLTAICSLPFVRLVALSGSLATLNADHRADMDLFVVTRGRRAWAVTLAVILLARIARRRRIVCLNFVLTDDRLTLEQQDLFSANQVVQLRPIVGREMYRTFVAANPFVTRCYPNFSPDERSPLGIEPGPAARRLQAVAESLLGGPSSLLDRAARFIYSRHLARRAASWNSPSQVRLSADCVKLHTRSHRGSVLTRFEAACRDAIARAERSLRTAATERAAEPAAPESIVISQEELVAP